MKDRIILSLVTAGLMAAPVFAHDAKLHKGKPVEGTIVNVSPDGMTLKADDGVSITVTLPPDVKVESGDETAGKETLVPGRHVSVFGTKLSKDKVVAREVVVDDDSAGKRTRS